MTVTLADVSYRDRRLLLVLSEHIHFLEVVSSPGANRFRVVVRRRRHHQTYTLARIERLHSLGLIKRGSFEGEHAIVLTPAGKAMALELAVRHPRRSPGQSQRLNLWWMK